MDKNLNKISEFKDLLSVVDNTDNFKNKEIEEYLYTKDLVNESDLSDDLIYKLKISNLEKKKIEMKDIEALKLYFVEKNKMFRNVYLTMFVSSFGLVALFLLSLVGLL